MNTGLYFGAPATGEEWTIEDVYALKPGENPPWNPEGILLDPKDFATVEEFHAQRDALIDASGYRKLYDEFAKGQPGSYKRLQYDTTTNRNRNLLLIGAAVVALFAFAG